MKRGPASLLTCGGLIAAALSAQPAIAQTDANFRVTVAAAGDPPASAGSGFATAMALIRGQQWDAARAAIDAMQDADLAAFARAELFLAAGSPRADGEALRQLINAAPALPQAAQLTRLAQGRGITGLAALPVGELRWAGASPRRGNPRSVSDASAGLVRGAILERIAGDDPAGAEAILTGVEASMTPEAQTEWRQRVAWSYYIENDDANARRLAATAAYGSGAWAVQASWTAGLAAWRQNDCRAAMSAFADVGARATEPEMTASGHFWHARAATACGDARGAAAALQRAAAVPETFYGLIAAEMLGVPVVVPPAASDRTARARLSTYPNVRAAIDLAAQGDLALADEAIRHQARIGAPADHGALLALAGELGLPQTQLFLAHNAPRGVRPDAGARFPAPAWQPIDGWRISPALVFAHTLQESQFRERVISPAGAVGLMQLRPGTAGDMGLRGMGGNLTDPATNLALGQSYIEYLRDNGVTGGLLPKVIAAYNAGSTPLARWNSEVRDNGDPLLWIESIPYWETRAYVGTVLRNLWIYEARLGTRSDSRAMLAQGRWPRVPGATAAPASVQIAGWRGGGNADR